MTKLITSVVEPRGALQEGDVWWHPTDLAFKRHYLGGRWVEPLTEEEKYDERQRETARQSGDGQGSEGSSVPQGESGVRDGGPGDRGSEAQGDAIGLQADPQV